STIVFILPLHLDYTKVIILILWWRNFQLEYWRTFQLVSTIYDVFTAEQIGCKVNRLYNIGLPDGTPYDGKRCLITQEAIHSKAQKSPFTGR
ncbi:hypothetical protein, partial [Bacteroides sp.]|uniref:hypothetical protein n=1 Tax=Bacteroides sp. TaxID=29523 RepID=UPI003AB61D8F